MRGAAAVRMLGVIFFAVFSAEAACAATIKVRIENLAFAPAQVTAHVGDTIEWVNDDFVGHSATARDGTWDISLDPHSIGHILLRTSGKIAYFCKFHPDMAGVITVVK